MTIPVDSEKLPIPDYSLFDEFGSEWIGLKLHYCQQAAYYSDCFDYGREVATANAEKLAAKEFYDRHPELLPKGEGDES